MVFVDLEKAFDRIPRDLIWWCLRKKGVPEEYVQIVEAMYRSSKTQVVTQKGETEYFPIGKGSFYIAQYPVRWTAQSALHFLPSLTDLFIPTPTRLLLEAF